MGSWVNDTATRIEGRSQFEVGPIRCLGMHVKTFVPAAIRSLAPDLYGPINGFWKFIYILSKAACFKSSLTEVPILEVLF